MESSVRYTEKFLSVQGEALHTGEICTWLRLFACSLQCRGFGQKEPGNPETWEEQRPGINIKDITDLMTIPTPHVGCDSDYSWNAKFKHLVTKESAATIAQKILDMTPDGKFKDGKFGHVFTGGEPMMQQNAMYEILCYWDAEGIYPNWVGIETNGTQHFDPKVKWAWMWRKFDIYFSISPKLLHVSGEQPEKAINIDAIKSYLDLAPESYLKFVLNEDDRAWAQAEQIVNEIKAYGYDPAVWVMPVGGKATQQLDPAVARIADRAIFKNGWNVSPRVHLMIWGDEQIGR